MLGFTALVICLSLSQVFCRSPTLPPAPDCGHPEFECVPYFQCNEHGVINSDGAGLIDIRTGGSQHDVPTGECRLNDPEFPGLCCRHDPEVPAPGQCINTRQGCFEYNVCYPPNTDGAGLIDIRTSQTTCWTLSGKIGACCEPPPITCPHGSSCVAAGACYGEVYDINNSWNPYDSSAGLLNQCTIPGYDNGICCNPPKPVDHCPTNSYCVNKAECTGHAYNQKQVLTPYSDVGSWLFCNIPNYEPGVCCVPPLLDYCPDDSQCVGAFECLGEALVKQDTAYLPFVANGAWEKCKHADYPNGGICCRHRPVVHDCPHGSRCVKNSRCEGNGYTTGQGWSNYRNSGGVFEQCYLSDFENGVCCQPPYTINDCPHESACVPADKCVGQGMDYSNVFHEYATASNNNWASCYIHELDYDGVCCIINTTPPGPGPTTCGVRQPKLNLRITGANPLKKDAQFGELPWQVIVFDQDYTFICGATLISNTQVLTAAHCVHDKKAYDIKLRFGEWQVNSFEEPLPYVDIDVKKVTVHPAFILKSVHNDIAIMELTEPISFNYHISPICLPSQSHTYPENQRCIVSGWGKDSFEGRYQHILKLIDLPLVSKVNCQEYLRKTRLGQFFKLDKSFMCAGGELNIDACKGDGGGPLICEDHNGGYSLAGITAWGIGCGQLNVPGVYVDVAHFRDWIEGQIYYSSTGAPTYNKK